MVTTELDKPLTSNQTNILAAISSFWTQHAYAPSVRDIQAATGVGSVDTVYRNLRLLRRRGLITFDDEISRSVRTELRRGDVCPLCGCGGEHG